MNRICLTISFAFLVWGCWPSPLRAQPPRDKVTFLNEDTGSRVRVVCNIVSYTGKFIRYQTKDNGPSTVRPAKEVISIETQQVHPHTQGLAKFAAGETEQAVELFQEALKQESRDWVRRDILAMLVECALRQDNYAQAGDRFLMIYGSDKTTRHFNQIPLLWTTAPPTPALKSAALKWQERSSPAAKLLAASALLFDPKYQSSASLDLQRFRTHADPRVRHLAITQLWRLDLQAGKAQKRTLERWQNQVRSMPKELRGGAYFLIGEGHRQARQYDRAAAALLWVPLIYDHDYQLSARACLNAADSLNSIGQQAEAITLYREVLLRYGQSSFAQDAKQLLESLEADQNPSSTDDAPAS